MKIMLIDDERLALVQLEMMLKQGFSNIVNEIKCFQLVSDAIEFIPQFLPDVVFLDIHMPEMTGLEAAELIQQINPNIEIIFVTAYDQFAIQAFELNALDYLLKPITQSRLEKTIERLKDSVKPTVSTEVNSNTKYNLKVYCLNKIRFELNGQSQVYPKWRTAKAQELFAYLIHHRGEYVSKYKIINMFTPEIDKKRGMTQLYTVVYQIRRCLKELGVELMIENDSIQESYCLKVENTVFDFEIFEQKIKNLNNLNPNYYSDLHDVVWSYEGNYMGEYDYIWADSERERLLQLWIKHAHLLLEHYEIKEKWTGIISLVERLFYYNPYEYEQVLPLLKAYANLGQIDKVKLYYEKYNTESIEEFDMPLADSVVEWYENWMSINMN